MAPPKLLFFPFISIITFKYSHTMSTNLHELPPDRFHGILVLPMLNFELLELGQGGFFRHLLSPFVGDLVREDHSRFSDSWLRNMLGIRSIVPV